MPDVWVERPRVYPYRCAISGRSKPEDGPYFEFSLEFQRGDGEPSERLYIAEKYLLAPLNRADSPVSVLSAEEIRQQELEREDLRAERDRLEEQVEDLGRQLDHQADVFARARTRKQQQRRRAPRKKPEDAEE